MIKKKVLLVGLTLAVLAIVATASAQPSILGGLVSYIPCIYTDEWAIFVGNARADDTNSSFFVDMNHTSVEIQLHAACDLVITLSAECYGYTPPASASQETLPHEGPRASSSGLVHVRCLVGDLRAWGPELLTSQHANKYETRTATFIANDVPAGTYTVIIQWATSCERAYIWWRTLTVIANGAGHL